MKVKVKRFDKKFPLPEYHSEKAAAMDLVARETVEIQPHQVGLVRLNMALQVPPDYWVLVAARSSLHKKGLLMANGIGVGDEDFAGNEDEYRAILLNFTDAAVTVTQGDRIAQMIVLPRDRVELEEVETLVAPTRGGIGSTG
nr:dUTPase [uncultured bacterium]